MSRRALAIWGLLLGTVLLFFALPLLAIGWRGAGGFGAALRDPTVFAALRLSLVTSLVSTGLSILVGTPLGWVLATKPFRGRALLETFIELPIVLPPAVAGIGLLMAFGRRGLLGQWLAPLGLEIVFTPAAVVLAQSFVAAPLYIRAAISAFRAVDPRWPQVAATLGASPWRIFWQITLPLAGPGLFGGVLLCWARALGEFGATIMVAGSFAGRTQTMPLAIYASLERDLNVALALALLLIALTFLLLLLLRLLTRLEHA
ncbi:MAG: molybdate ABC transporter permease subunit [Ardenticatenales bacterium]|nr:molybdate ABC transporter permease subunit [Ardenticatenales bacterium]